MHDFLRTHTFAMGFILGVGSHVFDTVLPLESLLNHTRMLNAGVVLLELDFSIIIQQSLMDGIITCFKMGLYEGHLGALLYACGRLFQLLHGRFNPNNEYTTTGMLVDIY